MNTNDIIYKLKDLGYCQDASKTQQDLFSTIKRSQILTSQSNRLNSGWSRAKYIIASITDDANNDEEYIHKIIKTWSDKFSRYQDQYLILEIDYNHWECYDCNGKKTSFDIEPVPGYLKNTSNDNNNINRGHYLTDELIDKVRESFTRFLNIINTHTSDFTKYIIDFERFINPLINENVPQYKNVFQIVDIDVFNSVIAKLQEKDPELKNVFSEDYQGTHYYAFRTTKYYRYYLEILSFSDFRNNISQQRKELIRIASTSVVDHLHTHILAMRTKPFLLLAGISGTGKSRIVKQIAFESCPKIDVLRKDPASPGNYQLIEVKPNWHDSTEVLGYESEIGGSHYVVTPFIRFLVKAMQYEDKAPFFVCMDEMNLAPVEQYFAEFLSILESRKLIGGKIISEPLIKADIFVKYEANLKAELLNLKYNNSTCGSDITNDSLPPYSNLNYLYERLKVEGLRLPSNLIVVGTVNMDETTHQFSRKVIDRAMTIEMNIEDAETPFKDFFNGGDTLCYYDKPQPKELFLSKVVQATDVFEQISEEDADFLKTKVPHLLYGLNSALNGTPFKIAYRVQNELILYFYSLREEKPDTNAEALLTLAMDAILMMKVLPRIEGDEDLLEKPLKALAEFSVAYPQARKKITEMQQRLPQAHFTSFWP
ncbi:MAG: hypothetical protein PUC90_01760 [Prevotella sp.]|nr:hypothetical protein [Prevotella sp.]